MYKFLYELSFILHVEHIIMMWIGRVGFKENIFGIKILVVKKREMFAV